MPNLSKDIGEPFLHPLIAFFRNPLLDVDQFTTKDWEIFLHSGRHADLLARINYLLESNKKSLKIPPKVSDHIASASRFHTSQARGIHWDIQKIHDLFAQENISFIVLKGSAYILCGLNAGHGRMVSDVDILVHKDFINKAEHLLISNGWFPTNLNSYDQRYYRKWMHEIPPLKHLKRGTTLDLHHTILPPTTGYKIDVDLLWRDAVPIPGFSCAFRLSSNDLIIHSAAHLLHNGEMDHGLRDLCDIVSLIEEFSAAPHFWEELTKRANDLDLNESLSLAIIICRSFFGITVPKNIVSKADLGLKKTITSEMFFLAIKASIDTDSTITQKIAELFIYVRSHYLRMPIMLLLPHLIRKSFIKR